jgi:hypothetical protein
MTDAGRTTLEAPGDWQTIVGLQNEVLAGTTRYCLHGGAKMMAIADKALRDAWTPWEAFYRDRMREPARRD